MPVVSYRNALYNLGSSKSISPKILIKKLCFAESKSSTKVVLFRSNEKFIHSNSFYIFLIFIIKFWQLNLKKQAYSSPLYLRKGKRGGYSQVFTNLSGLTPALLHPPTAKGWLGIKVTEVIDIVDDTHISIKLVSVSNIFLDAVHCVLMLHFYCLTITVLKREEILANPPCLIIFPHKES